MHVHMHIRMYQKTLKSMLISYSLRSWYVYFGNSRTANDPCRACPTVRSCTRTKRMKASPGALRDRPETGFVLRRPPPGRRYSDPVHHYAILLMGHSSWRFHTRRLSAPRKSFRTLRYLASRRTTRPSSSQEAMAPSLISVGPNHHGHGHGHGIKEN
jgi:hypothetical protein